MRSEDQENSLLRHLHQVGDGWLMKDVQRWYELGEFEAFVEGIRREIASSLTQT